MVKNAKENAAKKSALGEAFGKANKAIDDAIAAVRPKSGMAKWAVLLACALVLAFVFRLVLDSPLSAMQKFAASAIVLGIGGEFMRRLMEWGGSWGLIFFRDRSTLEWIDRQAHRFAPVWRAVADIGIVFGYGLSSYFVLGKEGRKDGKKFAAQLLLGIPCMIVFSTVLAPLAIGFLLSMVQHTDLGSATAQIRDNMPGQETIANVAVGSGTLSITLVSAILGIILIFSGLAGVTTVSILGYGAFILHRIALALLGIGPDLSQTAPGGAPLLPGINLPLVEGVLAMAVLLVVHELMHAFLSRIAKVKLDSAGIVFFGILPFGAFVDPDEKGLAKLGDTAHNRILGAGSAANLVTAVLTLFLLLSIFYVSAPMRADGLVVASGPLPIGAVVENIIWKGNAGADVSTSHGDFYLPANADGKLGIYMNYASRWSLFGMRYLPEFGFMTFIMSTLGLVFALNVLVGIVNLLPIPLFDGHHIVKRVLGEGLPLTALTWATGLAFVLNFVPWLFR